MIDPLMYLDEMDFDDAMETRAHAEYLARKEWVALPTLEEVQLIAAAFWPYVRRYSDCWLWPKYKEGHTGYGLFYLPELTERFHLRAAHRVAWFLAHGPIPTTMMICHHCDVKRCCRDSHLFLGTARDNVRDMIDKGRQNCRRGKRK